MTMFSMKPKFNLAEFLAEPAKPNSFRRRNTWSPAREPAEEATPEETVAPVPPKKRKP
jgi:hypothetical protein